MLSFVEQNKKVAAAIAAMCPAELDGVAMKLFDKGYNYARLEAEISHLSALGKEAARGINHFLAAFASTVERHLS